MAKLMALETQLASCLDAVNRKRAPKPRLSQACRWLWVFVAMRLVSDWENLAHVMQPATASRPSPNWKDLGHIPVAIRRPVSEEAYLAAFREFIQPSIDLDPVDIDIQLNEPLEVRPMCHIPARPPRTDVPAQGTPAPGSVPGDRFSRRPSRDLREHRALFVLDGAPGGREAPARWRACRGRKWNTVSPGFALALLVMRDRRVFEHRGRNTCAGSPP